MLLILVKDTADNVKENIMGTSETTISKKIDDSGKNQATSIDVYKNK